MPNVEALHTYLQNSETLNAPGGLEAKLPELMRREEICRNFFQCNVWDAEPHLLDDLSAAELSGDKDQVNHVREMIRAASWASHGRTNGQVATAIVETYLERLKREADAFHKQGMELWTNRSKKQIESAETMLEALRKTTCDEQAEAAVLAAEELIAQTWDEFIEAWKTERARNPKLPWPDRGVELPAKAGELMKELSRYRQIRDQLYYQRLYSHLCRIASRAQD